MGAQDGDAVCAGIEGGPCEVVIGRWDGSEGRVDGTRGKFVKL